MSVKVVSGFGISVLCSLSNLLSSVTLLSSTIEAMIGANGERESERDSQSGSDGGSGPRKWLTSAQLGSSITNRGNEFESHHIRNLPRLKWNMRTQTCNKSYQVMPVSLLRKGAWVHPDFRDASILWHIKSTQFYMHQDPEQSMCIVAGGNK